MIEKFQEIEHTNYFGTRRVSIWKKLGKDNVYRYAILKSEFNSIAIDMRQSKKKVERFLQLILFYFIFTIESFLALYETLIAH